jgi:hypothetical protein
VAVKYENTSCVAWDIRNVPLPFWGSESAMKLLTALAPPGSLKENVPEPLSFGWQWESLMSLGLSLCHSNLWSSSLGLLPSMPPLCVCVLIGLSFLL